VFFSSCNSFLFFSLEASFFSADEKIVRAKKRNSDENKSIPRIKSTQTEKRREESREGLFCLPYSLRVVVVFIIVVVFAFFFYYYYYYYYTFLTFFFSSLSSSSSSSSPRRSARLFPFLVKRGNLFFLLLLVVSLVVDLEKKKKKDAEKRSGSATAAEQHRRRRELRGNANTSGEVHERNALPTPPPRRGRKTTPISWTKF